jgi:membrane protein implicated in regulation of membrane protease activity
MLATALYVLGAVLLLVAAIGLLVGGVMLVFLPQLAIGGVLLIVGLAIERWRYKPVRRDRPDPRWQDTGERFVDPETGVLTAVYFDPASGERHYLAESAPRNP